MLSTAGQRRGVSACPSTPGAAPTLSQYLISRPPHLGRVLMNLGSISSVNRPAAKGQDTTHRWSSQLHQGRRRARFCVTRTLKWTGAGFILGKHCRFSEVGAGIWR